MSVKVGMVELIPSKLFESLTVKVGMDELIPLKLFESYGCEGGNE